MDLVFDWCRYPSIIIRWNPIRWRLLPLHLFLQILKYSFSHFFIIWCYCSRILHQKRERFHRILIPCFLTNCLDVHKPLNAQSINRLCTSFISLTISNSRSSYWEQDKDPKRVNRGVWTKSRTSPKIVFIIIPIPVIVPIFRILGSITTFTLHNPPL